MQNIFKPIGISSFAEHPLCGIDLSVRADKIARLKIIWIMTKVAAHTYFGIGLGTNLQYLPKAIDENTYGMQIAIIKADIRDRILSLQDNLAEIFNREQDRSRSLQFYQ
jgi:hypothetical protein